MKKQEDKIGRYGQEWMHFMEVHHQDQVQQMKQAGTFEAKAQAVHRSATDYRALLEQQFAKQNPPPEDFDALRSWYFSRDYYVDSIVMRERVLIAVTTP